MKTVFSTLTLLIAVWMMSELLFLDVFGIGRFVAKKKFPETAEKMGLRAISPTKNKSFSNYIGTYGGFEVEVTPEISSIKVTMKRIPGLFLNTFQKDVSFDTGNRTLDRFFTARQAPSDTYEKLVANKRLIRFLADFIEKWKRKISNVDIEPVYVECRMKYGNGHYIPASVLEPMTSDLVKIAQLLQDTIILEQPATMNVKD